MVALGCIRWLGYSFHRKLSQGTAIRTQHLRSLGNVDAHHSIGRGSGNILRKYPILINSSRGDIVPQVHLQL